MRDRNGGLCVGRFDRLYRLRRRGCDSGHNGLFRGLLRRRYRDDSRALLASDLFSHERLRNFGLPLAGWADDGDIGSAGGVAGDDPAARG